MIKTSIARKVAMALSGLFLILFLGQHFTINITSIFSEKNFQYAFSFYGQ
jgi:succinate dehydrogenase / fumarate reductase cytochrome b subunit